MSNEEEFLSDAKKMWDIKNNGKAYCLPIDFDELRKLNIGKIKTSIIKKMASNEVNYFIKDKEVFIQESQSNFDWKLNFMAYTVKVKILDEYVRVHAGFYMTAMTVLNHLENETVNKIYGYSHGAGAAPDLALLILDAHRYLPEVVCFEPPRTIFRPSRRIKTITKNFVNYIQGSDVVTKVPWWLSHLGKIIKVKGHKLPWYKKIMKPVFDHDIYWTKD